MIDICGYELPTYLQNFKQTHLTEVKNSPKSFRGVLFKNTMYNDNNAWGILDAPLESCSVFWFYSTVNSVSDY